METSMTVSTDFDAGHSIDSLVKEARHHGHHWIVKATVMGDIDPATGWPRGADGLEEALCELALELDTRNLNDMLPGVRTSAFGVAAAFMERLVGKFPKLSSIEVACSDGTEGRITRTPRS